MLWDFFREHEDAEREAERREERGVGGKGVGGGGGGGAGAGGVGGVGGAEGKDGDDGRDRARWGRGRGVEGKAGGGDDDSIERRGGGRGGGKGPMAIGAPVKIKNEDLRVPSGADLRLGSYIDDDDFYDDEDEERDAIGAASGIAGVGDFGKGGIGGGGGGGGAAGGGGGGGGAAGGRAGGRGRGGGEEEVAPPAGQAAVYVRISAEGHVECYGSNTFLIKDSLKAAVAMTWNSDDGRKCWWRHLPDPAERSLMLELIESLCVEQGLVLERR